MDSHFREYNSPLRISDEFAEAGRLFKVALEDVTTDMRRQAKIANFGIIYGISAFGLSQRLHISRTEAAALIQAYFEEFPAIKAYMDRVIEKAVDAHTGSNWLEAH